MVNYYKVLKISPEASTAEIKKAYRKLARELHPDVNGGSKDATKEFALIAKAYEVLSNPQERAFFDKKFYAGKTNSSIHATDSVVFSNNPHAGRLRRMAFENRYNKIVDSIIDAERREVLALQKVIFPTVALFVSTCFVAIFRPNFFSNSAFIGKIILVALFVVGLVHLIKRIRAGFEKYTYKSEKIHDSILEEEKEEMRPYSRVTAVTFLITGFIVSLGIGLIVGNYLEMFVAASMPGLFSRTLKPEFIFYPPIVVLLVDVMHSFASKMD